MSEVDGCYIGVQFKPRTDIDTIRNVLDKIEYIEKFENSRPRDGHIAIYRIEASRKNEYMNMLRKVRCLKFIKYCEPRSLYQ